MHVAQWPELLVYLTIVVYLQTRVYIDGATFSTQALSKVQLPGVVGSAAAGSWHVDLSDIQWREFRSSLPLLMVAMGGIVALSRLVTSLAPNPPSQLLLRGLLGLPVLGVLHGACAVYVVALAGISYALSQAVAGTRFGLPLMWLYCCGTLFAARQLEGLPFRSISPALAFLDSHRGMLRWHIHYNLLILRMLSFACDLHWARHGGRQAGHRAALPAPDSPPRLAPHADPHNLQGSKARVAQSLPLHCYHLPAFLAYVFYPPLYIAGPIITFNSFVAQLASPPQLKVKQVLQYGGRWLLSWCALELLTHTLYFNSIAKYRAWPYLERAGLAVRPVHYAMCAYWVIVFMWLKFLVIWRFFRLAALADGVDPPENMTRCVCNNYTVEGFWRGWHSSYNQWLVRYMYIPLGGSSWRLLNVWVIFTFVALWHDLDVKLLGWAWIMALAIAPEMAIRALGRTSLAARYKGLWVFRQACAAAAAVNIVILMTGNLVGFVVGLDGILPVLQNMVTQAWFVAVVLGSLFCGVQLMFWHEAWRGRSDRVPAAQLRALTAKE